LSEKRTNILIIEDETPASALLDGYVGKIESLHLVACAYSGKKGLEYLKSEKIDILLLDINLPDMTGIEILDELSNLGIKLPQIIFTTSHGEYALRGFELGVVDFLPKPFSFDRFKVAVERANRKISESRAYANETGALNFRAQGNQVILPYKSIHYLTSKGKSTEIHTKKQVYLPACLLKDLHALLPQEQFIRIHKQHVVNVKFVAHIRYDAGGRYLAFIKNDARDVLSVGVAFAQALKKRLNLKK